MIKITIENKIIFKTILQFDCEILDLKKNDNDQKKKEVVYTTIVSTIKHLDNEVKEEKIKLRYNFKIIFYIYI